jgi:2-amino-4-hydroxy-6-hydroxymethyldihydropteridine diphosphokinase
MARTSYVIGLGSNRRGRHGSPEREVRAGIDALGGLVAVSPIVASAPLGPSIRRFANAVALIESDEAPLDLLARLKAIEARFGRRRGQRWGARVIDLDIILWSGGSWAGPGLIVPHVAFRERGFVLGPLAMIVPGWRDPVTNRTIRHLAHVVDRRAPRP